MISRPNRHFLYFTSKLEINLIFAQKLINNPIFLIHISAMLSTVITVEYDIYDG